MIPPQYEDAEMSAPVRAWYESKRPGILFLTGPTGSGKTRMLYAVLKQCKKRTLQSDWWYLLLPGSGQYEFLKYRLPILFLLMQRYGKEPKDLEQFLKELSAYTGYLLLDDLGAEKLTEYLRAQFYVVIAEREEWERPTLVTSNLSLEQLDRTWGARIASRLGGGTVISFDGYDEGKVLKFKGKDWRLRRPHHER